jgi:hypothetical protein
LSQKIDDIELRRAYRRLLCTSEELFKDYAVTVLSDLLDECGVFDVGFQLGAQPADNGYLAGRRSIGMLILERLGITDLRRITEALSTVLPEDIEIQEKADNKEE